MSAAKGKNRSRAPTPRTWRVSIIRKRGELLGTVEAPTREAAERAAVRAFSLSAEDRKRIVIAGEITCRLIMSKPKE
jgi:hypothetical protein